MEVGPSVLYKDKGKRLAENESVSQALQGSNANLVSWRT